MFHLHRVSVTVGAQRRGQVAAGGESPHAQALRIDAVFCRMRADQPHRTLSVFNRRWIVVGCDAIIQHEGGNSLRIQPPSDLEALVANSNVLIPAARNDKDRGARGARLREKRIEARNIRFGLAKRAGDAVGPQEDGVRDTGGELCCRVKEA